MLLPIRLPICNAYLLKGDRPVLVDSGRPKDAPRIEQALRAHGVDVADLSLIVHTHAHWDHCGGTAALRERGNTAVAVHAGDAARLRSGSNGVLRPTNITAWALHWFLNGRYPAIEPTLLLEDGMSLASHGVDAVVVHTPGHTEGSVSVLAEGELIVGDLIMGGWWGGNLFPTHPGLHYFMLDIEQGLASLRKALDLHPSRIHPGHGGPLDPAAVHRWLEQQETSSCVR